MIAVESDSLHLFTCLQGRTALIVAKYQQKKAELSDLRDGLPHMSEAQSKYVLVVDLLSSHTGDHFPWNLACSQHMRVL